MPARKDSNKNATKPRAFRVSVKLWEMLSKASLKNHRSITGELAIRLEKSFEDENND